MGILRLLFGRTPHLEDPAPQIIVDPIIQTSPQWTEALEVQITLSEEAPLRTPSHREIRPGFADFWDKTTEKSIAPLYCAIDYMDAGGAKSRRRITIRKVIEDDGRAWVSGYCHERKAPRRFRVDRIGFFITPDGEAIDPATFLRDMCGVKLGSATNDKSPARLEPIQDDYFRHIAPALTILVAASRSDAHLHNEEVDAILQFAEREAFALQRAGQLKAIPELDQFDALAARIHHLRPVSEDVAAALIDAMMWDEAAFSRLGKALVHVVHADGIIHENERAFVAELHGLKRLQPDIRHDEVWAYVGPGN